MPNVICIVGPTGTGKTRLSIALAHALDAEVVSCDSMQVYRGMDIGTAKPSAAEREGVPHHMMDVADPQEDYSVGRYVPEADACVQDILSRGKTALIVGGTGLYVDALIAGREFAPRPQDGVRQRLEAQADAEGMQAMLDRLRGVDPAAAARLHPSDRKRILRALEVYAQTGQTMTQHNLQTQTQPPRYKPAWIGLDYVNRMDLYRRIDRRVEDMLAAGLLSEIQSLLDRGVPESCTAMQAIGYKEFLPVLRGQSPLEEAVEAVQQASRRYAKRQLTWFRRNHAMRWLRFPAEPDFSAALEELRQILGEFDRENLIE